jgi:hypothetical protein
MAAFGELDHMPWLKCSASLVKVTCMSITGEVKWVSSSYMLYFFTLSSATLHLHRNVYITFRG